MEIRHLGATPRYRGPAPGGFRVRGLPLEPADREFILVNLPNYAQGREMSICTDEGFPEIHNSYAPHPRLWRKIPPT